VSAGAVRALERDRHPVGFAMAVPGLAGMADAAERELRMYARTDRDGCCGYFPVLAGVDGIVTALPACIAFAHWLPRIDHAGAAYRFSFVRLSLVQQSVDPAFHLDSDADTALSGDVADLAERHVLRLLMNLSTRSDRTLHYLDVDPRSVPLEVDGSYVRAANPGGLHRYARAATIPRRCGSTVHGLAFTSNLVLHSGVDDASGHFVAAYGTEAARATRSASQPRSPSKAASTRSRISHCSASPTAFAPNTH
jgi:hypothetical protein